VLKGPFPDFYRKFVALVSKGRKSDFPEPKLIKKARTEAETNAKQDVQHPSSGSGSLDFVLGDISDMSSGSSGEDTAPPKLPPVIERSPARLYTTKTFDSLPETAQKQILSAGQLVEAFRKYNT
jgi:hypothetical protein